MTDVKYIKEITRKGNMCLTSNKTIRFLKTNYSRKELFYIKEHTKEYY
jgi:hypothetical protein